MNFISICLHSLDMRDFHSKMRNTPFLDSMRDKSIFIPMGRAQGHHQGDSLNAEMTGVWTARYCNSSLTKDGYEPATKFWFPKTVIEILQDSGYKIITCIGCDDRMSIGTWAVNSSLAEAWLKNEPERLKQFNTVEEKTLEAWIEKINEAKSNFYAHIFLRATHRPWGQNEGLCALAGKPSAPPQPLSWPYDAYCARRLALEKPDEFAALRRRGLNNADRLVRKIFQETQHIKNTTYIVYSNHGEVFDHFRHNLPYKKAGENWRQKSNMIVGTSHGPFPYEVLYANMQIWVIPKTAPKTMSGIGRLIDYSPTVLDLANIKASNMDGESMLKYVLAGQFPNRPRYAENRWTCISMVNKFNHKLVSTGSLKWKSKVRYGPDHHRLAVFDLTADPFEFNNLIGSSISQDIIGWAVKEHKKLKMFY